MRFVSLDSCEDGMIIGRNVFGQYGVMLLRCGTPMKQSHIEALQRLGYPGVYIDDDISKGIEIPEAVDMLTHNRAEQAVKDLFAESKFSEIVNTSNMVREIETVLEDIITQIIASRAMISNVTSLKTFDNYTYQHCVDVGILSIILGREFNLPRRTLIELGKAAIFHDIGKTFIPKHILNKPGKLTAAEFEIVREHPQLGHDCLKYGLKQSRAICEGALYHHERHDGSGYPDGICGDEIPFFAKIIAITDVYDAITSKRVYKEAMVPTEAYEFVMSNSGTHFDPKVVEAFVRKVPPFPVGCGVALSDGRKAIVVENRQNVMTRPLVKLLSAAEEDQEKFIDLAADSRARSITIVGTA